MVAAGEMFEDAPARGVSEGRERAIQKFGLIFNHLVK
jgi:hypothetical protein